MYLLVDKNIIFPMSNNKIVFSIDKIIYFNYWFELMHKTLMTNTAM